MFEDKLFGRTFVSPLYLRQQYTILREWRRRNLTHAWVDISAEDYNTTPAPLSYAHPIVPGLPTLSPLPRMIPPVFRRGIRRNSQFNWRNTHSLLRNSNHKQPQIRSPQLLARIPNLIVLSLQFQFPLLSRVAFVDLPCAVDRPVAQHAHRTKAEWARRERVVERVPN